MKAKVESLIGFTQKERIGFLRRFARKMKDHELNQAVVVLQRRDGSININILDDRRTTGEVIGMLERAKLEEFEDMMEYRRSHDG